MKKLNLAVYMKEKEYGQALARGMAYLSRSLDITICEEKNKAADMATERVLITDDREMTGPWILLIRDVMPAEEILERTASIWHKMTGNLFFLENERRVNVWKIGSRQGGSGTTSVCLTMARLLAEGGDRRVLYINAGTVDDYEIYIDAPFEKASPKKRFIFHVCYTDEKDFPDRFAVQDLFGVYYLRPDIEGNNTACEAEIQKITDFFRDNGYFSHIVIDAGKNPFMRLDEDVSVEVINTKDCRRKFASGATTFTLMNFAQDYAKGMEGGRVFYIPEDEDSFLITEKGIEISMTGMFCAGLEEFIKKAWAES